MNVRTKVPGQPGPSMADMLDADRFPIRPELLDDRNDFCDGRNETTITTDRYLSEDYARAEDQKMWERTWQMACREEQLVEVGDHLLYEIAGKSIIVVRSAPDEIRAFFNSCPHRARAICQTDGNASHFRCPFHGMMWHLDGRVRVIPFRWDFPEVSDEDMAMFSIRVARWQGFVFINMDPDAISFEDYMGDVLGHVAGWDFENRYIALHVGQVIRSNWKVALESFLEDFHLMGTHPEIVPFVAWGSTQYTARKDQPHWSRLLAGNATPTASLRSQYSDERVMEVLKTFYEVPTENLDKWTLPLDKTSRQHLADLMREQQAAMAQGMDFSQVSDSEMIDTWFYLMFPNIFLFGGYQNIFYRFRPWEGRSDMSLMEIYVLLPLASGQPRPASAKFELLAVDQKFTDHPGLNNPLGAILNQDVRNMEWVQKGLRSSPVETVRAANYLESMIKHFHHTLDRYLDGERPGA